MNENLMTGLLLATGLNEARFIGMGQEIERHIGTVYFEGNGGFPALPAGDKRKAPNLILPDSLFLTSSDNRLGTGAWRRHQPLMPPPSILRRQHPE